MLNFHVDDNAREIYWGELYFPEDIGVSGYENEWYSQELNALDEPVLFTQTDKNKTIYRFTCLRSFNYPFSIRVEINKDNDSAKLFFKYGMDLLNSKQRSLKSDQIESLLEAIEENDYWNMPFEGGGMGLDGSEWIVEGVRDGEYKAISRWSPKNTESYSYYADGSIAYKYEPDDSEIGIYNLGHFFIELSGQTIEDLY